MPIKMMSISNSPRLFLINLLVLRNYLKIFLANLVNLL